MKNHKFLEQLFTDLVNVYVAYEQGIPLLSNQGQALDGYSALANYHHIAKIAFESFTLDKTKTKG